MLAKLGVAGAAGSESDDGGGAVGCFERGADEGTDAVLTGGGVGARRPLETEVVGEGDGRTGEFGGAGDDVFGQAGTAEEGEGGAGVEFGEHLR